jgi:hypothetical protein
MTPKKTNDERIQTHLDAITAQLGARATPGNLLLAERLAGLAVACELHESGKVKLSAREYIGACKLMRDLCIAIGTVFNPRTATTGQRAASAMDAHAAMVLDED